MVDRRDTILARQNTKIKQGGVIQYHLLFRLAYQNLVFKKLRTFLTLTGVVIGIGAIVFLLAFGFGLQDLVSRQVIGSNSVQTVDVTSPKSKLLKLNNETVTRIKSVTDVQQIGKSYSTAGKLKNGSSQTETVVFGADHVFIELSSLKFNSGKPLDADQADRAIISSTLVKTLGIASDQKAVNQTVSLNFDQLKSDGTKQNITKDLKVQGVYQSDARAEMFVSTRLVEAAGFQDATQLKIVATSKSAVPQIRKNIEALGFTTASPLDTLDQINQVFNLLHFVLIGFGGIGMVIAILGMFNTLTISLLERTREIGLMISLGARKQDVKRLFIFEALLLSVFGGFFGIASAFVLGTLGNFVLTRYAQHNGVTENIHAFIFSPGLMLTTLLLSSLLGLIVVYFPARRASQINPIDALHFE